MDPKRKAPADKREAAVIKDTDNYIKETDRQLYDKTNCKQLTEDPNYIIIEC